MKKIDKLTESQQNQLTEYRNEVFKYAVSTETDRDKAASAALELTKNELKNPEIHWVTNPEEGKKLYDSLRGSLQDSLYDSLWESLQYSLRSSLQYSLGDSIQESLWDSLYDSLCGSLRDSLWGSLRDSLQYSLWDSLQDSLQDSLCGYGWVSFYRFSEKTGIVEYEEKESNMLKCYENLLQSCFAIYVLEGHIILVEKPKKTEVKDGELVSIEW